MNESGHFRMFLNSCDIFFFPNYKALHSQFDELAEQLRFFRRLSINQLDKKNLSMYKQKKTAEEPLEFKVLCPDSRVFAQ